MLRPPSSLAWEPRGHCPWLVDGEEFEPHKPGRLMVSLGVDLLGLAAEAAPKMVELPKVSKRFIPGKTPDLDPVDELADDNRSIKAVRDRCCSKKNRHDRYRRFVSPTSARIEPKQYLFSGLRLLL